MATYISLLCGINVGGQKNLKMEQLVTIYESLGFSNIRTYLQSGNVIFDTDTRLEGLSTLIEEKIGQALKLSVSVLLRTPSQLRWIVAGNPFLKEKGVDVTKLYVTFLSSTPAETATAQVKELRSGSDRFVILDTEVYLYCPQGYGRTKFSNDFFERKLGVTATTRNWNTVNALLSIAESEPGKSIAPH